MQGRLIVVSGPSGAGKDTVLEKALPQLPHVRKVVTHTTRPRRASELPGRDYVFVSREEFESSIQHGNYLEWAEYAGHLYGTPKIAIDSLLSDGFDALLKIEIQGAKQVKSKYPDALTIFILPPSAEELARRLRNRADETPQEIAARLSIAESEIAEATNFSYHLVNDDLERAAQELVRLLSLTKPIANR